MLGNFLIKLDAFARLGLRNLAAVALYRFRMRKGWIAAKPNKTCAAWVSPSFRAIELNTPEKLSSDMKKLAIIEADDQIAGTVCGLGSQPFKAENPPNWHANLLSATAVSKIVPWFQYSDADENLGDIKGIWELSRFDWALVFARAYRASGDLRYLKSLNQWLSDWCENNPPYRGPNWMCGQEASIRLLQLLRSAYLLDQADVVSLASFIELHVERIAPTISYAIAQDNNHATSEAAALFIAGCWMVRHGPAEKKTRMSEIATIGRTYLERLIRRLVFDDGGFAQYSTNYHRLMLMTLSQVELWRRHWGEERFSEEFYRRAAQASRWLGLMVDEKSGLSPNFGSNDGANAYRLNGTCYGDYRAACQLAFRLFRKSDFCKSGVWDEDCVWLKVDRIGDVEKDYRAPIVMLRETGLCRIQFCDANRGSTGYLRIPVDDFRPHQCDALHFDLFNTHGRNLLRDAGTYSYSNTDALIEFAGTCGHNSITFDNKQPMPRLSRFLFARWLKGTVVNIDAINHNDTSITAEYLTAHRCLHRRTIALVEGDWKVEDDINGHMDSAVLQWRLPNDELELSGDERIAIIQSAGFRMEVTSDAPIATALLDGWESPTYGVKEPIKIFQVSGNHRNRKFFTHIRLSV